MPKKWLILLSGLVLVLLSTGLVMNQEAEEEHEDDDDEALGRNLVIKLVVEPEEDKAGLTVVTATEHFAVHVEGEKDKGHFEGDFRGKIDIQADGRILVEYELGFEVSSEVKDEGFTFGLQSSILLKEDTPTVIAQLKDKVLKLSVSTQK